MLHKETKGSLLTVCRGRLAATRSRRLACSVGRADCEGVERCSRRFGMRWPRWADRLCRSPKAGPRLWWPEGRRVKAEKGIRGGTTESKEHAQPQERTAKQALPPTLRRWGTGEC
ncbi:hypothetical protein NDU88_005666 [Pleurodeles waltl]|uniref:Uncharacterized protein n=1 Tax=Pleurodeles waltl TaxID=8319 RepID=A0AAV7RJQ8_PLEWA|nr:hypothetical protein NDU88_005666 [Pleurodeles waltl]